jgi:carbonic anhydrase/acetyltransferase-like protein (isoleucine patch superfamily)
VTQTKYDFGDEPTICQDFLSRHRQLFPLLSAGRPVVHPQVAYVAPCATLIGSVTVGKGASIWYGAVLRADTTAHAESFHKTDEELLAATKTPVLIPNRTLSQDKDTVTEIQHKKEDKNNRDEVALNSSNTTDNNNLDSSSETAEKTSYRISEGPFPLPDPERTHYSGGGIVIGEDTNIQDGCILSARTGHCRIGQGVTVGHLAQIHSATVGDFSLIGMGSIIQEGAVIEEEAFVAAGAVVKPGVVVQSGGKTRKHPSGTHTLFYFLTPRCLRYYL